MFITEVPVSVAAITPDLMRSLRSVDSSDFKSKYKNDNIELSDW